MATIRCDSDFPALLEFLFFPSRYKVAYGGRGGGKSWGFARALLIQATKRPLRVLCARETQNSIADSVHKTLADQIELLGLKRFYEVLQATIRGRNGSEFTFAGLKQNIGSLKSYEACDICWVEEAQLVSGHSWDVLIPTVRKDKSEIWVSFNPELETDETYRRFVISPPANAKVVKINWQDNPWVSATLRAEIEALAERDPDAYAHIYEGSCQQAVEGAVFKAELSLAEREGRLGRAPWQQMRPVDTFWDIGWADSTAIWFAQAVGQEYHIIDYIEGCQQPIAFYAHALSARPYAYGTHWLPHDAQARELGSGRSIEEQLRSLGLRVRIVRNLSVADGIAAARAIFNRCWFDARACADGLQALRHYRYEDNPKGPGFRREPLHDQNSHAGDAFRYLAVALRAPAKEQLARAESRIRVGVWA